MHHSSSLTLYDAVVRTTVDLDPGLHAEAVEYARRERITLGEVLNDALRARLHPIPPVRISENTGLAVIRIGRPITPEEVAAVIYDD